jgi:hypothetical protein
MRLTEEQKQALADADAHLSLARSALGQGLSPEAVRIGEVIDKLRNRIRRKLRGR